MSINKDVYIGWIIKSSSFKLSWWITFHVKHRGGVSGLVWGMCHTTQLQHRPGSYRNGNSVSYACDHHTKDSCTSSCSLAKK